MKSQENVFKDPFQLARQVFQQLRSGTLMALKEKLGAHILIQNERMTLRYRGFVWPSAPGVRFGNKPPTLEAVNSVIKKARGKSSPDPNGVPCLLYKRCPNVLKWLHKILRSVSNNLMISEQWMIAEGVNIPKEQNN
ncbi:reverse transcriptase [Plakobranchus ocellatus]|uniref:Reverse transcriptase n=1 Tax=Plakobranchus ocellatus TaxID=259542 RepID=A0AAV3YM43_9GAST|nr:reverse transcriptase [Plakobranchus ocellatus]